MVFIIISNFLFLKIVDTRNPIHCDPVDVRHYVRTLFVLCKEQRLLARYRCVDIAFRHYGVHCSIPLCFRASIAMAANGSHSKCLVVVERLQV